jgi:protein Tex
VHPEAYPVVRRIVEAAKTSVKGLIGNAPALRALSPKDFVDGVFGLPTVTDILRELEKPGRDPRPAFKAAVFKDGVETLDDLKPGMVLEGAVTNVAAFGAFVDIGVHQDGLVHVSAMSKTFVKDPREVVKPGDIVRVKVLEVDLARKRIALTLRLDDEVGPRADRDARSAPRDDRAPPASRGPSRGASPARREESGGALAEALRRAALVEKRK